MEDDYMFCVNTLNDIRKLSNELKGKNRTQRIVLFFHFTMLRAQFQPIFEEENNNEDGGVGSSKQTPGNNSNNRNNEQVKVKTGWNATSQEGVYTFKYTHSLLNNHHTLVHLKMIPMENHLIVHATCSQTDDPSNLLSLELNMNEHVAEYMTENEGEYKWKALQVLFKNAIVYPLLPSLKPSLPPSSGPHVEVRGAVGDPLRITPKQGLSAPLAPPPISPYNVGHSDLYPDFSGGFEGIGSGGMQVGPNHAIFNYPPPGYTDDDTDPDFHFNPPPNRPYSPIPPNPLQPGIPKGPTPRYDPVGPLPSQNNKKDKRSPFGPDPDHLPMPGADKDWFI